jgi:hypothetical protein
MKWTKYSKLVLNMDPWCKIVECFEFSLGVCSMELSGLAHFQGT